ncbi:gamma-glutamyltransferase [Bradyrhizobium sp. NBAIM08]|nr:gamma-glutamyltransferase [Bradyrhizobium sp. NBAIM08]
MAAVPGRSPSIPFDTLSVLRWDQILSRRHSRCRGDRRGGKCRLANPESVWRVRLLLGSGPHRRRAPEPQRLLLARSQPSQSPRTRKSAPTHLIASIAKRDGRLWSVLGCMGADGQPQIQLQLYSAMIDHGLDIQEAIELSRFLSAQFRPGRGSGHPALGGSLPRHRRGRAGAQRAHHEPLEGLERDGRPRPWNNDRSAKWDPEWRGGPA